MIQGQEWLSLTNAVTGNPVIVHLPLITVLSDTSMLEKSHAPEAKTIVHFQKSKIMVCESIDDILKEIDLRR